MSEILLPLKLRTRDLPCSACAHVLLGFSFNVGDDGGSVVKADNSAAPARSGARTCLHISEDKAESYGGSAQPFRDGIDRECKSNYA